MAIEFKDRKVVTLQNKAFEGGQASATSWMTLPHGSTQELADEVARRVGAIAWDTTLDALVVDDGTGFQPVGGGGGGGADTSLSNIAAVEMPDSEPLTWVAESDGVIQTGDSSTAVGTMIVRGGEGNGIDGGSVMIVGGSTIGNDDGGHVTLLSGESTLGESGEVRLVTGDSTAARTGNVSIRSGTPASDFNSGAFNFSTGSTTGTGGSGSITLASGSAEEANSGGVFLYSGNTSIDGNSGSFELQSGDAAAGDSGSITLRTGQAEEESGDIFIATGASLNDDTGHIFIDTGSPLAADIESGSFSVTTGNVTGTATSGNIIFTTGSSAAARGVVSIDAVLVQSSGLRVPTRMITGSDTLTINDYKVILADSVGPSATLTLPAGVNGLSFCVGFSIDNVATWSLIPNGSDQINLPLDAFIQAGDNRNVPMVFLDGFWYAC